MTSGLTTEPLARRSRLSPEREAEIHDCILELVAAEGYDNLTMDQIATATKSSKATLYRQWGSKEVLVAAAMRHLKYTTVANIDTGSLRGDLREIARRYSGSNARMDLICSLSEAGRRHPELARAIEAEVAGPGRQLLNQMLGRAIERGEMPNRSDAAEFLQHMMAGAALARPMAEQCDPDAEYMYRYIDAVVLPALGARADQAVDETDETPS
ncbi:MAG TPA: TetR/AcrR family transcriptional regulator [Thermomicrobiales bacterium]|nr:TetR/AcrR family transcriptional regulator [Thermomicrobiales bacterium]